MSHEFRTPLASVIGYSDELRELRPDDEQMQRHLAAVARGARHLLNLVENLLDQASLEVETLAISPRSVDLAELSDEIEQLLRPMALQRQLTLAWWFGEGIPERIWVDATRLKQVLINLVGNAIKFTRSGSVSVEFAWAEDRLQVSVEDTGPGIPEDEQARVFEPFNQANGQAHGKGAGLGLSISRALVEAMGGGIHLQSREGHGSRFEFEIDAKRVDSDLPRSARQLRGRRILVADDDPDMRELLRRYLAVAGCQVVAAGEAREALRQARGQMPDAVILDIDLGKGDGNAVARELRTTGYPGAIIALSGNKPAAGDDSREPRPPFDAYWTKPMRRGELLQALADLLA
jgi:two-component system, sensor histidine kinase